MFSFRIGEKYPMLNDFKKFILRGNVVDLAVGIVIGTAFTAIVKSLVADIITPLVGSVYKSSSFESAYFTLRGSKFMYGDLVNSIISFLIMAVVVFFFVVQPINRLTTYSKRKKSLEPTTKICPECLNNVPKEATRCMYCTTHLKVEKAS
jgi:large conductance mechanosensitive channel